jgi:hypothetical protein
VEKAGALEVDGWDIWQEGDMTVSERMHRYRNKNVTGTVTGTVTSTVTLPSPPSETVRQQDGKTFVRTSPSAVPPPGEPWSREASDDWIEAKGGQPPGRIFPALKRAVGSFGWERVRPAWRFYLATTGSEFVVVDKFVSAFGEWEKRAAGGAPPGAKATPGNATLAAAARVMERHEGRGGR